MNAKRKDSSINAISKKCESFGVDFARAMLEMMDVPAPDRRDSAIGALENFLRECQKLNIDAADEAGCHNTIGEEVCDCFSEAVLDEFNRCVMAKPKATDGNGSAMDITDKAERKIGQVRGILALVGITNHTDEVIPDDAVNYATWAARDLLKEVHDLVGELNSLAKAAQPAGASHA